MVVVTDSWVKFHRNSVIEEMSDDEIVTGDEDLPKAILICRANSHLFKDRTILLDEPVKVGRSVARAKPKINNAIFDCKVLSRNHAVLWFEDGKFYLKDTKSSNGTFVNSKRLAAETESYEVSSGDIVQFGVCVIENNRKVTHGCIIATLKLYLPGGKEATAGPNVNKNSMIPIDELYRLNQIIQEASDREESLRIKLSNLQSVVDRAKIATNVFWENYVGEERLLSRISTLESQLHQSAKNWSEDRCKQELSKIQEENVAYQLAAIEALEKVHSDKLDTVALATELKLKFDASQQDLCLEKRKVLRLEEELDLLVKKLLEEQGKNQVEQDEYEAKLDELRKQLLGGLQHLQNEKNADDIMDEYHKRYTEDDVQKKEEILEENDKIDNCHVENNNQEVFKDIRLMVEPIKEVNFAKILDETINLFSLKSDSSPDASDINDDKEEIQDVEMMNDVEIKDEEKPLDDESPTESLKQNDDTDGEFDPYSTIKYQIFQSIQKDMKKKIKMLQKLCESHLDKAREFDRILSEERKQREEVVRENKELRETMKIVCCDLEHNVKRVKTLKTELKSLKENVETEKVDVEGTGDHEVKSNVSYEELVAVEEELVTLKERYAQVSNDKSDLERQLETVRQEVNKMRGQSHNMTFFYVAPLVLIVLYLLISKMFS